MLEICNAKGSVFTTLGSFFRSSDVSGGLVSRVVHPSALSNVRTIVLPGRNILQSACRRLVISFSKERKL